MQAQLTRRLARALHAAVPALARARGGVLVRAQDLLALAAPPPAAPAAAPAPAPDGGYLGASFANGQWHTTVELNGKRTQLGPFGSAKEASDAFVAATAVVGAPRPRKQRRARASDPADAELPLQPPPQQQPPLQQPPLQPQAPVTAPSARFKGVQRDLTPGGAQLYEAVFVTPEGREVSGGEYEGEEEAARAYDALCRMYLGEAAAAACNFPVDPYTAWVPPEEVLHAGQVPTLPGVPLTVEEVTAALEQERGLDVRVVPLAGRSDLAEYLVFATGRSVVHMRRMADCVARAQRKRALPSEAGPVAVEGRDMDDWMVVDCGNIIVNVMDAEARECFDLERMYEGMQLGVDPYAGMTYEQWLEANPVPEKWLARLERDEREMEEAQRTSGKRRGGLGYNAAAAGGAVGGGGEGGGGGGEGGGEGAANPHHFSRALRAGRPGRKTRANSA